MHCVGICRVSGYNVQRVKDEIDLHEVPSQVIDGVLCVHQGFSGRDSALFIFSYGVIVFWELSKQERDHWVKVAEAGAEAETIHREDDTFNFVYEGDGNASRRAIRLPDAGYLTKLAVSHAVSQSVLLGRLEQKIESTIASTRHIPVEMARTGRQPLTNKQLRKMLGQLFIDRSLINLNFDLLDEPAFFWEYEEYEPLYTAMSKYLDIDNRITILNQKIEVIGELLDVLSQELNHRHSSRLEWIIIWLIAVEVVFTFVRPFVA